MALDEVIAALSKKGLVRKEKIGLDQVEKLLVRAHKDLKSAKANLKIDEEIVYAYAYLAMLRTARALMFLEGLSSR